MASWCFGGSTSRRRLGGSANPCEAPLASWCLGGSTSRRRLGGSSFAGRIGRSTSTLLPGPAEPCRARGCRRGVPPLQVGRGTCARGLQEDATVRGLAIGNTWMSKAMRGRARPVRGVCARGDQELNGGARRFGAGVSGVREGYSRSRRGSCFFEGGRGFSRGVFGALRQGAVTRGAMRAMTEGGQGGCGPVRSLHSPRSFLMLRGAASR